MELTIQLSMIRDVFYVSQLKKCVRVPEKIIKDPDLEIESDLTYEEKPIKILDQKTRDTRTKPLRDLLRYNGITIPKKRLLGNRQNI